MLLIPACCAVVMFLPLTRRTRNHAYAGGFAAMRTQEDTQPCVFWERIWY